MREFSKMVSGENYNINDPELREIRYRVRDIVDEFNALSARAVTEKERLIRTIFGRVGENVHFEKGMRIDYGCNTHIGNNVFINFNFVLLDCAPVTIGNNVFIAPDVQIYTAQHPLDPDTRNQHIGSARPINIGDDVWIGGGSIILPGVTIGKGSTIGAGSVVKHDIPAGVIAAGNPCQVKRVCLADKLPETVE
ncbi:MULTISPECIES: sugar O-acetyltransferase [Buttiauxella]|jgi:maltose O-acetyltransferase|uniref:sugar O-acetyltransferase n=1 Tax=Buttiauxella TaxID=82976 RepID=UPI00125FC501|nr:sugar O-acetyltransferase [Buttiauxella massiliensis]MRT14636.1 maltose O-acetyltransferase [Enterobacteriaceae bacterium RIT711]